MNTPSAGGPSGPSVVHAATGLMPDADQAANAEIFAPVPQQQEMPLAIVRGQPVLQMPQDLYIPPDARRVWRPESRDDQVPGSRTTRRATRFSAEESDIIKEVAQKLRGLDLCRQSP